MDIRFAGNFLTSEASLQLLAGLLLRLRRT
jgi:hypothetical protein